LSDNNKEKMTMFCMPMFPMMGCGARLGKNGIYEFLDKLADAHVPPAFLKKLKDLTAEEKELWREYKAQFAALEAVVEGEKAKLKPRHLREGQTANFLDNYADHVVKALVETTVSTTPAPGQCAVTVRTGTTEEKTFIVDWENWKKMETGIAAVKSALVKYTEVQKVLKPMQDLREEFGREVTARLFEWQVEAAIMEGFRGHAGAGRELRKLFKDKQIALKK
jgi:hypothetical protein